MRKTFFVCLLNWRVCAIGCIALHWQAMWNPFMWGFQHLESRHGHVFAALLGHNLQFALVCCWLENAFAMVACEMNKICMF